MNCVSEGYETALHLALIAHSRDAQRAWATEHLHPVPAFRDQGGPPPPPPPPPPPRSLIGGVCGRAHKLAKAHPYALGVGVSLAVTVGLGLGTLAVRRQKMGYSRTRGTVKDGMLKDAIGGFPLPRYGQS